MNPSHPSSSSKSNWNVDSLLSQCRLRALREPSGSRLRMWLSREDFLDNLRYWLNRGGSAPSMDQAIHLVYDQISAYHSERMHFPKASLWAILEPLLRAAYLRGRQEQAQPQTASRRATPPPASVRQVASSPNNPAPRRPLQTPRMGTPVEQLRNSIQNHQRPPTPPPFSLRKRPKEETREVPWWKASSVLNSLRLRINRNPELRIVFQALCEHSFALRFEQKLKEASVSLTMEKGQSRLLQWILNEPRLNPTTDAAMLLWEVLQPLLMREARATQKHNGEDATLQTPLPANIVPKELQTSQN